MPSPFRCFTALSPSRVSGHLTTTLGATCASSLPSFTMPSKSVATTSRLTSPGTILQISSTSGRKGRFSFAISDGLVVQPSTRPIATPSRRSLTFAESRKIFIPASVSGALHADRGPGAHRLEHCGIPEHPAEHGNRARGPDLAIPAGRGRAVEDAEGRSGRPVGEIALLHDLRRVLGLRLHWDAEVDLVAPRLARNAERERIPDRGGGLRVVQHSVRRDLAHGYPNLALSHRVTAWSVAPRRRARQAKREVSRRAGGDTPRCAPRARRAAECPPRPRPRPRRRHSTRRPRRRPTRCRRGCRR